jgi:hypothetical protein
VSETLLARTSDDAATAVLELQQVDSPPIRIGIHDASRFEWSVSIPLPEHGARSYEIEVELEVPTNAVARLNPWEQLQMLTRLDGTESAPLSDDTTVDALRRGAVWLTHLLARARDGFARHCRVAAAPSEKTPAADPYGFLAAWIEAALKAVQETRQRLTTPLDSDLARVTRERALIDEFTSVRLLEMLGDATRAAAGLAPSIVGAEQVRSRIAKAAQDEFAYRRDKGFPIADASSPASLESYVIRAATLKKHFEEVFFLERETYQPDERVQQWVTTFVALLAGCAAFLLQIGLAHERLSATSRVGSGLVALAVIAGVCYAARDRIKEFGRAWLAGKLYRFHAQRVSRYRVPEQRFATREVILRAREWCTLATQSRPDPLNPEAGASLPSTRVHYLHKGVLRHDDALTRAGMLRVRHVFRYDFTPLFARLHDEVKVAPVQDERGVAFVDAPRRYHVPVFVRLAHDAVSLERRATVVLDKRGLARIDPATVT